MAIAKIAKTGMNDAISESPVLWLRAHLHMQLGGCPCLFQGLRQLLHFLLELRTCFLCCVRLRLGLRDLRLKPPHLHATGVQSRLDILSSTNEKVKAAHKPEGGTKVLLQAERRPKLLQIAALDAVLIVFKLL